VLVTFALLVQFASFLSDVERERSASDVVLRAAPAAFRRGARRLRADLRGVPRAYLLRVEGEGTVNQRFVFTTRCRFCRARAT
jgi:hypothetical protein